MTKFPLAFDSDKQFPFDEILRKNSFAKAAKILSSELINKSILKQIEGKLEKSNFLKRWKIAPNRFPPIFLVKCFRISLLNIHTFLDIFMKWLFSLQPGLRVTRISTNFIFGKCAQSALSFPHKKAEDEYRDYKMGWNEFFVSYHNRHRQTKTWEKKKIHQSRWFVEQ